MRTELFLAGRYLRPRRNAVSLITLSSIVGVMLGVAVLLVVLAVMTGFTDLMKSKLLETQSHYQIRPKWISFIDKPNEIVKIIEEQGGRAAPLIQAPVLIQIGKYLDPRVVVLGVSTDDLEANINLKSKMLRGELSLEKNEIIISYDMANRWRLDVGDRVIMHSAPQLSSLFELKPDGGVKINDSNAYLPYEFKVAGIYNMGKYDFDSTILFANIDDTAELLKMPWGSASVIYGWGNDPFNQNELIKKIEDKLPSNLTLGTWEENNQQLLGVLAVEKRMMFFLLIFIVLVAAFSITNTLITSVYQKTREIGLLKSLGASDRAIMNIFVLQGFLVGAIGSIVGVILGTLIIFFRNDIVKLTSKISGQDLFPKEFYYFNELPAKIIVSDVMLIVVLSILLCTIGAMLPAISAARLDPGKALRYE